MNELVKTSSETPGMFLRPGEEIVSAPRVRLHAFRAYLREAQQNGEIGKVYNWTEKDGELFVIVERLRNRRNPFILPMFAVAAAVAALVGIVWLVWMSLPVLAMAALAAVTFAILMLAHVLLWNGRGCSCIIHGSSCR
jgi:hypothetical protein